MSVRDVCWVGSVLLWMTLYSCTTENLCLSNQHAVQAGFYSIYTSGKKDKDTTLNVSVYGVGMEDSIYESVSTNNAFLPLSFNDDTTSFVIKVINVKDTIQFVHTKKLDFVSGDCGYVFQFHIDTVLFTDHKIDSVAVSYPQVKYGEDVENVKIFVN